MEPVHVDEQGWGGIRHTPPTLAEISPGLVASLEYLIDQYGYAGVLRTLKMMEAIS